MLYFTLILAPSKVLSWKPIIQLRCLHEVNHSYSGADIIVAMMITENVFQIAV